MTPPIALRTYLALRMGMVAVIFGLGIAVFREIKSSPGDCVNRSISAYYYTPVQSVFVGALIALALAMVALWGKTVVEDACLNLAGMLAPVVAFVPTLDASYCSLATPAVTATTEQSKEEKGIADQALIDANSDAVNNDFFTLLVVIGVVLVLILAWLIYRASQELTDDERHEWNWYIVTWALAVGLWILGFVVFNWADDWFDHNAHRTSAYIMFGLIIAAVIAAGLDKRREIKAAKDQQEAAAGNDADRVSATTRERAERRWRLRYLVLGGGMIAAFLLSLLIAWLGEDTWWVTVHKTFLLEAAEILLLAVFWTIQTLDRRKEGAPTVGRPVW